ncbi:MAG: hypothetical protein HYX69_08000 [Planctomycetia bacterium]|nr:hypothetical protein [Planctomycetia bacterium]
MRVSTIAFRALFAILSLSLAGGSSAWAIPLTVDGSVADWGFTVADNNGSTFVPAKGLNLVGLFVEDQNDKAGEFASVGPGLGGQNYDSEAFAAALQGGNLYLVIVTGQRPDDGFKDFAPGDIRVNTTTGSYGIEMGGGPGGGPGGVLNNGAPGSTYTLDGNGLTTTHTPAAPDHTVGSVWLNPTWINAPQFPWLQPQMTGGTRVWDALSVYTRDTVTAQHAIIEVGLPLSVFDGTIKSISWYPSCGNDELLISHLPVPEPSSALLAVMGAASGTIAIWKRRRA